MSLEYKREFIVRSNEVLNNGNLNPVELLKFMQEAARDHAAFFGVAVPQLQEKGLTWYISRYNLHMESYPQTEEKIIVKTWPSGCESVFALREFEFFDELGNQIGSATSSWVIMDVSRKRPVQPQKILPKINFNFKRAIEDSFKSLPIPSKFDSEKLFNVHMQDIDVNNHVNNVVYLSWVLETIPPKYFTKYFLTDLEISFKGEAFLKDTINSLIKINGDEFLHSIVNKISGIELARLRTKWKPLI